MADSKITALDNLTSADPANDMIPIVDVSATPPASGNTKRISINNLLACSPSATLASATITGALTANGGVNLANATAINFGGLLTIYSDTAAGLFIRGRTVTGTTFQTQDGTNPLLNISNSGIFTFSDGGGGTRMTLDATGLGIGASPSRKLSVSGAGGGFDVTDTTQSTRIRMRSSSASNFYIEALNSAESAYVTLRLNDTTQIDPSGNVGIGVTPSAWLTAVKALDIGSNALAAYSGGITHNAYFDNTDSRWEYKGTGAASFYSVQGGLHAWYVAASGTANTAITTFSSAAMTLDASGRLLVGATSAVASGSTFENLGTARQVLTLKGNDATSYVLGVWSATTTGDNFFAYFGTEASTTVRGSVTYNRAGGLVAYNTTSDYRAKDIIGPISNSGSLIDSLKVYVGKMHGATIERPMLVAHEAQEVAPYAVSGTKDEVDAEGKPKYQQMDASALVPLLIAEIQSLRARVQTLEAK